MAEPSWQGDPLEVAKIEARQWRESASHHRQIAEHYRTALVAVMAVRSHVSYPSTYDFDAAMTRARQALANPPEWDGRLLSADKPDRSRERAALIALYHSIPDHTDFPSALWGAANVLMLLRDDGDESQPEQTYASVTETEQNAPQRGCRHPEHVGMESCLHRHAHG